MTVRFPAALPYDKWPAVNKVYGLMIAGDWAAAKKALLDNLPDVQDAIGAGNYWRALFVPTPPVTINPPLAKFETRNVGGDPHINYTMQMAADGNVSVEVSGSPWIACSVGKQGEFDPARESQGGGTTTPLAVKAGEWATWTYDAPQGGQNMRPQLL